MHFMLHVPYSAREENRTGMPDNLKAGVESLSGMDMSDIRVHYIPKSLLR